MKWNIRWILIIASLTLISCGQQTPEELMSSAKANIEAGDKKTAVVELKALIAQDTNNAEARLLLGNIYLELGDYAASEKELRRADDLGVPKRIVLPNIARALYYQEDFDGVIALSGEVDKVSDVAASESVQLFIFLSKIKLKENLNQLITPVFEDKNKESLANAYLLFTKNDIQEANTAIAEFPQDHGNYAEYLFIHAIINEFNRDYDKAIPSYNALLNLHPNYHLVRFLLIDVLIRTNQLEQATTNIDYLMALNSEQPIVNFYKASVDFINKDYENSFLHSQKAKNEGLLELRNDIILGLSALKLGKLEQAYASIERSAKQLPKTLGIQRVLAKLQLELGLIAEAGETIATLKGQSELDDELYNDAANVFAKLQDFSLAQQQLQIINNTDAKTPDSILKEGLSKIAAGDYSGVDDIRLSIELAPEVIQKWLLLAEIYVNQGKTDSALALARALANDEPALGLVLEGQIYGKSGNLDKALALFEKAYALSPEKTPVVNNYVRSLVESENYKLAMDIAKTALKDEPSNQILSGEYLKITGATGLSEEDGLFIESLVKDNPELIQPKMLLAAFLRKQGKIDEAFKILDAKDSRLSDIGLMSLGDIFYNQDKFKDAEEIYKRWLQLYPEQVMPYLRLIGTYSNQKEFTKVRQTLNQALAKFPNSEALQLAQVQDYIRNRDYAEADKKLNMLSSSGSKNTLLPKYVGIVALNKGEYAKAVENLSSYYEYSNALEDAINLSSALAYNGQIEKGASLLIEQANSNPNPLAKYAAGEYTMVHSLNSKAKDIYENILASQPSSLVAINNLAMVNIELGNNETALEYAQQANNLAPEHPLILDTYGWALYKNGLLLEAETTLEIAYNNSSKDPSVGLHYAQVLIERNKKQEARQILNSLNPRTSSQDTLKKKLMENFN
ncbi:XrtA/PEP-CTERM system TPR-repeat protein PrsT [Glaciecola sp. 1036]|uniref:XrtA/PEP-CTERM system TPR-repeat protein PrsT n=1 Tax=Alteromonadaceae TaxID=72275 RepID=UPI003D02FC4F